MAKVNAKKTNIETPETKIVEKPVKKVTVIFTRNVLGSHGCFAKDETKELAENDANYFVKIGVAKIC